MNWQRTGKEDRIAKYGVADRADEPVGRLERAADRILERGAPKSGKRENLKRRPVGYGAK